MLEDEIEKKKKELQKEEIKQASPREPCKPRLIS